LFCTGAGGRGGYCELTRVKAFQIVGIPSERIAELRRATQGDCLQCCKPSFGKSREKFAVGPLNRLALEIVGKGF